MTFEELSLIDPLVRAVADAGYKTPSPIQQRAIPPVLTGRDLLGCAQTGTGKTAAFALPILQLLAGRTLPKGRRPIRALVLTPTRELALQIAESFALYGKYLPLKSTVIFGGVGQAPQVAALKAGVDILVATPGRLNDLIGQGYVKLDALEIFVLDEADRMLDMGFINDVKKVLKHLPKERQTLLFSATMPKEIVQLASGQLHNPAKVFVTPQATTVEKIQQQLYKTNKADKRHLLAHLLRETGATSALVFTRTKHGADRVVRELSREGIKAAAIHGNKSQNARQEALARFKDGRVPVLVATDIAARGLDIQELSHVFNYDLPNIPETYVHRIGRTGRAGHGGTAISFCSADELEYLADIEKLTGIHIPEVAGHPWPLDAQAAAPAPIQAAAAKPMQKQQQQRQAAPKQAANAEQTRPAPQKDARPKRDDRAKADRGREDKGRAKEDRGPAKREKQAPAAAGKAPQGGRGGNRRAPATPFNPYENRTGGRAIITKRPVWGGAEAPEAETPVAPTRAQAPETGAQTPQNKGDDEMSRNNRRRGNRNRTKGKDKQETKQPQPGTPKNANGVFDFSEEELAEDQSLRLINRSNSEAKYASFEDFLKDH